MVTPPSYRPVTMGITLPKQQKVTPGVVPILRLCYASVIGSLNLMLHEAIT